MRRKKALGEEQVEDAEKNGSADDEDEDDLDDLDEMEDKEEGPLKTLFELNDTLFAEAELEENGNVGVWLGVSCS